MANSPGTLSGTMVTLRVIDFLKEMFPPILRYYLSFTDQRAKLDQTITTRIPGASAVYDARTGYTPQDVTDVDKSVTMDQFKATSIKFTPEEMSQTNRELVDEHAAAAANNLGADLMDNFFGKLLTAAFANETVEPAANYDDDTIRGIRKKLNNRKVPVFGRIGIINSDAFEALTGDGSVITVDNNPNAHDQFVMGGNSMRMRGFDIFEYPQLPDNGESLNGAFAVPGGLIGATAVPRDANEAGFWDDVPANAQVQPETDPDSGITLLQRRTRHSDGSAQLDLAWIFGFAAGDPARVERVVDA